MKKIKLMGILAAAAMVAGFASCDLKIAHPLGEKGYDVVADDLDDSSDKWVAEKGYFQFEEIVNKNSTFSFESDFFANGISITFMTRGDVGDDWANVLETDETIIRLCTMDYRPAGTYKCNIYEGGVGLKDTDETRAGELWNCMLNTPGYITISFDTEGNITYYLNGVKMVGGNNKDRTFNESTHTIGDQCATFIDNINSNGTLKICIDVKNLIVGDALDDAGALALYNALSN